MSDQFFRRRWEERRGDEFASWGLADYLFATNAEGVVEAQWEIYDDGHVLVYDVDYPEDDFGFLPDQPLDLEEFGPHRIDRADFEAAIQDLTPHKPLSASRPKRLGPSPARPGRTTRPRALA